MKAALAFIGITDETGTVSLSNLALMTCLVRFAMAPGLFEVVALFLTLVAYSLKKYWPKQVEQVTPAIDPAVIDNLDQHSRQIQDIQRQVDTVKASIGIKSAFGKN